MAAQQPSKVCEENVRALVEDFETKLGEAYNRVVEGFEGACLGSFALKKSPKSRAVRREFSLATDLEFLVESGPVIRNRKALSQFRSARSNGSSSDTDSR